jgi:MBG domain (YGX type)/Bacterial Ig-like domain (group 3)
VGSIQAISRKHEGSQGNRSAGQGNSPEMGNLTAYLFLIVPIQTTTTVTADVTPQLVGQPVILTAQIAPPAPVGVPDATGRVTFYEGTTVLGTGSVNSNGQATFTTSSLSLGSHTVTATYSGDTNYGASTSSPLTVSIVNTLPTTLELMGGDDQAAVYGTAFAQPLVVVLRLSNGNPVSGATVTFAGAGLSFSSSGVVTTNSSGQASVTATGAHAGILLATVTTPGVSQTVNFALTVTPAPLTVTANSASRVYGAANPAFTGTVTGAVLSDTFTFSASTIALTSSPVGAYPITPSVTGTALANYTVHSVDGTLTVTPAPLTVTANNASRLFGQPNPTLTATITGFVNGDSSNVVSGAPSLATTATQTSPVGTYPITATRGTLAATNYGFAFFNGTLTVTNESGSVTLTALPNPVASGHEVTLTATVPAGATGTVTFDDGTTVLGTVTIVGTTATLVVSTLTVGSHTITAVYSGDTNFTSATSTAVILVVTPDFAVVSITPTQEIPPGASANFDIDIPSVTAAFTNPVTLSASGLPSGASYTFSPATVTPGSAGATSILTVTLPQQSAMHRNMRTPLVLAVLLLPFAAVKRVRAKPPRLLLWLLLTITSFAVIAGCGTGGYFSQSQRTYTITVTGTSGSLVRTTTVTLTVE